MGTTEVQLGKGRNVRLPRYNSSDVTCTPDPGPHGVSGLAGEKDKSRHPPLLFQDKAWRPAGQKDLFGLLWLFVL